MICAISSLKVLFSHSHNVKSILCVRPVNSLPLISIDSYVTCFLMEFHIRHFLLTHTVRPNVMFFYHFYVGNNFCDLFVCQDYKAFLDRNCHVRIFQTSGVRNTTERKSLLNCLLLLLLLLLFISLLSILLLSSSLLRVL